MKKTAALFIAVWLLLCGSAAQALEMTGLETETVTREWESSLFFARMEALTGVQVSAHAISDEKDYQKLLSDMLEGEVTTDVLFKAALTRDQERDLLDAGALVDLAPLIDANMPNLSALLEAHPQWRETIALEDGRIASLPLLNERERQVCVWINAAWLENLGIDMPDSLSELTEALLAIRDGDPNGNYKADEVAANLTGVWEMRWLLPYFGIVADDYHIARVDGEAVFAPELPAYRDFVALLADWYALGILTPEAFTGLHSTASTTTSQEETVVSGLLVSVTPYTLEPVSAAADYVPLLMAGPDGEIVWRDMLGAVWTGCFAVTSACQDVESALRWVDALYAEEGAILGYAGVEGEDYTYNDQGLWSFNVSTARTINDIRAEVIMYTGAAMPGLSPSAFLATVDSEADRHVLEQSERVREVAVQVTPAYALGKADQARADALAERIGGLVDVGIARFATGELELNDDNWEAFLAQLREAGSEELTQLFAAAR